jgi:hypothetical protein
LTAELTEAERTNLAMLVLNILEEWNLSPEEQVTLLGMGETTKPRHLSRFRQGKQPLPEEEDVLKRAEAILGIQHSLHLTFPLNHRMPHFWLNNRNRALKGIPLQIMLEQGSVGISRVWHHLDCTQNWVD